MYVTSILHTELQMYFEYQYFSTENVLMIKDNKKDFILKDFSNKILNIDYLPELHCTQAQLYVEGRIRQNHCNYLLLPHLKIFQHGTRTP